ncbi:hypothetical protein ACP70R_001367 [Stipagrostis hirtigluma subsp. patula]
MDNKHDAIDQGNKPSSMSTKDVLIYTTTQAMDGAFDAGESGGSSDDGDNYRHYSYVGSSSDDEFCGDYDDVEEYRLYPAERWNRYVVLTEAEIQQRLSNEAAEMAAALSVPPDWALALLGHYRWNTVQLQEDWSADQGRVRDAVGLRGDADADTAVPGREETMTCGICLEDRPSPEIASAGCAHHYCHDCWRGYVAAAVDDGPRCLSLRCPDASCSTAVLRGTVERFATDAGRAVYARRLSRSYVEARGLRLKPCPAAGCGCAVDILWYSADGDVQCRCGQGFCARCGGAPHWPASCAAMARWARAADEASADWILLNTKPCPRCRRPIERVDGCHKVRCAAPCSYRFCWSCLGPWAVPFCGSHRECVGDYWAPEPERETEERALARRRLDRFLRYQDMWMASLRSRRDAEREVRRLGDGGGLAELMNLPRALDVAAAWEQVAEGRRVLGNACAHGLSLREAAAGWRAELFEHQHGEADAMLKRLQRRAQEAAALEKGMAELCIDLRTLTAVARHFIGNFAKAVQDGGLPDGCAPAASSESSSENPQDTFS